MLSFILGVCIIFFSDTPEFRKVNKGWQRQTAISFHYSKDGRPKKQQVVSLLSINYWHYIWKRSEEEVEN